MEAVLGTTSAPTRARVLETLVVPGQLMVTTALVAFGVQQYLWGDFVPGRAPGFPDAMPGRLVWAYLSGAALVGTGLLVMAALAIPSAALVRAARAAAVAMALVILTWAGVRRLPWLATDAWLGGDWTRLGKALMLFGGCMAVAGALPPIAARGSALLAPASDSTDALIYVGRICLGSFFILCGIQHFIWIEFVATLVPTWIPGPVFWSYFAGIALIAGGAGMLAAPTATLASRLSALMVFLWVLMLHIPRALAAAGTGGRQNEWVAVFEALAVSGIALVVAVLPSRTRSGSRRDATAPDRRR